MIRRNRNTRKGHYMFEKCGLNAEDYLRTGHFLNVAYIIAPIRAATCWSNYQALSFFKSASNTTNWSAPPIPFSKSDSIQIDLIQKFFWQRLFKESASDLGITENLIEKFVREIIFRFHFSVEVSKIASWGFNLSVNTKSKSTARLWSSLSPHQLKYRVS